MTTGKRKGNNYEREMSRRLSLWLSENERDDLIWRTHNSGGRFTTRMKKNKVTEGQDGDLTSTCYGISANFLNMFSVELKCYKDINLWGLITKAKKGILGFWEQAKKQAKACDKIPLLILKQNHKPELLISDDGFCFVTLGISGIDPIIRVKITDSETLFIWDLKQFLGSDITNFRKKLNDNYCLKKGKK